MSDGAIRQDVIDELDFEPSIDAANVGVAVKDGIVTLTGNVKTYIERMTAEHAATRVKGVKGLASEIEVVPFGSNKVTDEDIVQRCLNVLKWNTTIPEGAIQVKVSKGWVTLEGRATWQYQKDAAESAIRRLAGVVGITNWIAISPQTSPTDIKKRIEEAFRRDAEVEAKAITVSVTGSTVTLEGRVKAWAERKAAERAAWSAPGVKLVDDRITVL
ncbi:MAG: BON domain-containing protein [Phyllobacterium sp.]|uniref:BON domain-containing protein n=1 Tax=Phyllobacterium sp. TaxID=1871046 RepID=UPI0030F1569A